MSTRLFQAVALVLCLISVQPLAAKTPLGAIPLQRASLAVVNTTVIDPETGRVLPNHTIVINGDRIVAVLPSSQPNPFTVERSVDGTGKFAIPGLMDMHAHLFLPEPHAPSLNLLLANGVTGIREMSGDCWEVAGDTKGCIQHYRALQAQLKSGSVIGPDILRLASTMVMGPSRLKLPEGLPSFIVPQTPQQGRFLVRHLHGRKVDLIKTHDSIPTAVFAAMMDEARELGLEVSGHVPFRAGVLGAAKMGYRSIEHARDPLYDCSRYGPVYRRAEADAADGLPGAKRPENLARLSRTVDQFDAALCERTLRAFASTGAYYTPTHVTREMEARAGDVSYRANPARKYILLGRQKRWEKDLKATAASPPAEMVALDRFFRLGLTVTGLAHRAGVPIMAGTDLNDTMIVPGFSLHQELQLLARAGLAPMDVLRSATVIPARYLGQSEEYGGISARKEADIVLLNSNPLASIANTADIFAVITNGRAFDRNELDALLAEVERLAIPNH